MDILPGMLARVLPVFFVLCAGASASAEVLLSGFSGNHVKRYNDETGAPLGTYIFDNDNGLSLPHELLFGPDLNLYVCSAGNDAIYRYDGFNGAYLGTFVPTGTGGLDYPASMVWGPDGHLYVSSQLGNEVIRYDGASGAYIDTFVTNGSGGLNGPSGLKFGPNSNLFVVARFGNQVLEFDGNSGTFVRVLADTNLNEPFGLDFGADGHCYVASGQDGQVQRFDLSTGDFINSFVTNNLSMPVELEFGPDGNLYVASFITGSVERYDGNTGQWIDRFIAPGIDGVNGPNFFVFRPPQVHPSGSLRFFENDANDSEYGQQLFLPPGFGAGEFTLELFVRLDNSYPVGPTGSGLDQRINWSDADPAPYANGSWWFDGNFLLDGHNNADFSQGTCSLQFYGGGRLRWQFGDGGSVPSGGVWAMQAHPATNTPTLLDGAWHEMAIVRRWIGSTDARLELWIDGNLVGAETSDVRTDMPSTYWNSWTGFPGGQEGWFWGAEKQAAIGLLSQYEDFKGFLDEVRFWNRALATNELTQSRLFPLVGVEDQLADRIGFDEGTGATATGRLAGGTSIVLFNSPTNLWQQENAPFDGDADGLPDWWEERFYEDPTNTAADSDSDLDRADALEELHARTDPTQSNSVLIFDAIVPAVDFTWQSIGGRRYRLEYRDDPLSDFIEVPRARKDETEMDVGLDLPGTESFLDDGLLTGGSTNTATRVYRVRLTE